MIKFDAQKINRILFRSCINAFSRKECNLQYNDYSLFCIKCVNYKTGTFRYNRYQPFDHFPIDFDYLLKNNGIML